MHRTGFCPSFYIAVSTNSCAGKGKLKLNHVTFLSTRQHRDGEQNKVRSAIGFWLGEAVLIINHLNDQKRKYNLNTCMSLYNAGGFRGRSKWSGWLKNKLNKSKPSHEIAKRFFPPWASFAIKFIPLEKLRHVCRFGWNTCRDLGRRKVCSLGQGWVDDKK